MPPLASYKANLANYLAVKENVLLAQEVYDVIQLQYRSGIKTYLEVITSETDLRTSQINYFNALYQVLSSKIDVQKSVGEIKVLKNICLLIQSLKNIGYFNLKKYDIYKLKYYLITG